MAATATKRATAIAGRITAKLKAKLAQMQKRENPPLKVGDTVKYKSEFLRSIGAYTGDMGRARGEITGLEKLGTQTTLASVKWNFDLPGKVNVANLIKASTPNPGTGAFKRCVRAVTKKGGAVSPRGVCAAQGRKKYGKKKFQQMAAAGKRKAAKNAITMTRELAWAAATDAGNRSMKAGGRSKWSRADYNSAARTFARLWPKEKPNPFYGDLDAETSMVPAWKYYDSKAARDADARIKEGAGKTVVLGHSMFGFKEGHSKKWRMRLVDHRGNPSTSALNHQLAALKRSIIELQERYDRKPTVRQLDTLTSLRAKYARLGRKYMAAASRGNPAYMLTLGFLNPVTSIGQGAVRADVYALKGGRHEVRIRGQQPKDFTSREAAMKFARVRVHELVGNPDPITGLAAAESLIAGKQSLTSKLLAKLKGKANPEASAAEMYQMFHGLPAEKVIEYRQTEHVHEWLWAVGTLNNIHVTNGKKTLTFKAPDPKKNPFEDVVMVAMTEDGKQIYFRGGDQALPLDGIAAEFGMTEDDVRDHMEIGRVTQLTYQTRKNFEDEGRVNVKFFHDLGKEHAQNKLPMLMYKPLNPSMDLVGGRYKIAPLDKKIGASPGIVG